MRGFRISDGNAKRHRKQHSHEPTRHHPLRRIKYGGPERSGHGTLHNHGKGLRWSGKK
jgi:hypothetical protein